MMTCLRKIPAAGLLLILIVPALAQTPSALIKNPAAVFLTNNIIRPLRYTPAGTDFVITNGAEFFNRPLYGGISPFRVDAGDKPECSLYLPGRGGNLRLGIKTGGGVKWLNDAQQIIARYHPGSMLYEIRDPLLGAAVLHLAILPMSETRGLLVRAGLTGRPAAAELVFAFGGVNGMKGQRNGDIGCEREPVTDFFQLRPEQCRGNEFSLRTNRFILHGRSATLAGIFPGDTELQTADATKWNAASALLASAGAKPELPVVIGRMGLPDERPVYLALQQLTADSEMLAAEELPQLFLAAEARRQSLAEKVMVVTPDAFINAAAAALCVAADAVWDDHQGAYLHGGVAWRTRLLGWRVSYAGDALGWHDRTAQHFAGFAEHQNEMPVPAAIPPADAGANLSRNETALHSNGDLTQTHYDMNLVGVDAFFRHLLWTGDLAFAKKMWPVIERHLAWERRLFRREFGAEKLPLYEAYCCIWASDDLAYNGGGATHSSAYNLYHNRMAARVAKLLGQDPTPYQHEADLIAQGMQKELWLRDCGWFAEWKDLLGLQLIHPNAALWTFYHTVDSEVPTPLEAWQMSRFVDTQIAHIPLRGAGVPDGNFTLPTTSWMPYTWSLNNVVMAESAHTALAYWQANRPEVAYSLFKGALLDSMYLGLCPGNVGMCTYFDANRRESQRDFGDGSGATARALIEGLFGVQPDLLAGEIKIHPGFPARWTHASIQHPDFNFAFQRDGDRETFAIENKFAVPLKLRLQIPAGRDSVAAITINGQPATWRPQPDSVGRPRIEIETAPAREYTVVIEWRGQTIAAPGAETTVAQNAGLRRDLSAKIIALADPQHALRDTSFSGHRLCGVATGQPGHRTVFAQVAQGDLRWWEPVALEILAPPNRTMPFDWNKPVAGNFETVNLDPVFNDQLTRIFRNDYLTPRSPFCSLATPKQGLGSWCHPADQFNVDDSGLRAVAAKSGGKIILPNGVPLATPGPAIATNIAFVSQWDNYPREISTPLNGRATHAFLLLAGSTSAMQSRFDNGEVIVTYADGTTARLALHNPTTWWPIEQDYYIDDFAFARTEPLPVRVDLQTGKVRILEMNSFKGKGRKIAGGAATVLELPLDPAKELSTLTLRALANEVVIGLMSFTLAR